MAKFIIQGGNKLEGEVRVSGNKNSMFPLMAASLLGNLPTTLKNVPQIRDVEVLSEIIQDLGGKVVRERNELRIDPSGLSSFELKPELAGRIRGSIVLAAPLLVKFGKVNMPRPGGDQIGLRPITTALNMLRAFGAKCESDHLGSLVTGISQAGNIFLEEASPTTTEMAMIIAASMPEQTVIENAASEPHVVDLAQMLVKMGVEIEGAGSSIVKIKGKSALRGVEHIVRPDHTEVGTFIVASAITGGDILIHDAIPEDLKMMLIFYSRMGIDAQFEKENSLRVKAVKLISQAKVFKAQPWPGFPSDLISPFIVLATQTQGTVLIHDWMFEGRMYFVDYLIKMGANITLADPHRVIVVGPTQLHSEFIPSPDIRAGGALVLAALTANGESVVDHAEVVERGYEAFEQKLANLGANIRRDE